MSSNLQLSTVVIFIWKYNVHVLFIVVFLTNEISRIATCTSVVHFVDVASF